MLTGNGYDYLTGGGGLVLSLDLAEKLADCECPLPSSPDDMWLGVCLAKLKIPVIHSPLFHQVFVSPLLFVLLVVFMNKCELLFQARPVDYALEYLAPHRPISFHKHWMIDPVEVYEQWFESDDVKFYDRFKTEKLSHTEL